MLIGSCWRERRRGEVVVKRKVDKVLQGGLRTVKSLLTASRDQKK